LSLERDPSGQLRLGGALLAGVVQEIGTPTYAYDLEALAAEAREMRMAFEGGAHLIAYAVKANGAGPIVRAVAGEGCGADIVSGAELLVALGCGIPPERIVYSGVAKGDGEIDRALACGERGIGALQVESVEEIDRVEARARALGRRARVSVRVNPGIDVTDETHAHIATGHDAAKFGVSRDDVALAAQRVESSQHLELVGISAHAGSQLASIGRYLELARVVFGIAGDLRREGRGQALAFVDTGGGFGIDYGAPPPRRNMVAEPDGRSPMLPRPADFIRAARAEQLKSGLGDLALCVEPGRSLVAPHGVLLARVVQTKVTRTTRWVMIDAGMNDLLRPALYQARHRVVPLDREVEPAHGLTWRVVGPVCESSDDFGEHPLPPDPPAAVAILDAGAYGYAMASTYNGRPLPAEAFLRGGAIVGRTQRVNVESWASERIAAGEPIVSR
jgi:diaminopimelate decarboxylase